MIDRRRRGRTTRSRARRVILGHVRRFKWLLVLAGLAMVATTITTLARPWPLKIIIDTVLADESLPSWLSFLRSGSGGGDTQLLGVLAAAIVLLAVSGAVFDYLQTIITSKVGFRLVARLRLEVFDQLQRLPLSFHHRSRRGELVTRASSDTKLLREALSDSALALIGAALTLVTTLVVMVMVNWRLSLIPLATLPSLAALYRYFQVRLKESVRLQRKREGRLNAHLTEILASIATVQAFGREEHESARYAQRNTQNTTEGIRTARIAALMNGAIGAFSSLGLALLVFFGSVAVTNGRMTIGELLVLLTYTRGIYRPIKQMVKLAPKFTRARVGAERIGELLALQPEIVDAPGAVSATGLRGAVEFRHVTFSYGGDPVLNDVSFFVSVGEHVAIVGPSGAGKSTLASLLLRLYDPDTGVIFIDGRGVSRYQQESLRRRIGLVMQNSIMFGTTIRENISYGKPDADLDEIRAAARLANIDRFVVSLPDGYDTELGEMGSTISGGQRQRLAIARALVKQPSLLVFDEPTASLDPASRLEVQRTITHLQRGRTVLVITHDLGLAAGFDRIIVLDAGRIVETGTHAELAASGGAYERALRSQVGDTGVDGVATAAPLLQTAVGRRRRAPAVEAAHGRRGKSASVLVRSVADMVEARLGSVPETETFNETFNRTTHRRA